MIKILFVCLGNICRSPLAEGILKTKLKARGLERHILVDSCGTSKYHIGEQPDSRAIENARTNGIVLNHRARQFEKKDFRAFTYILAMDDANLSCIQRLDYTKAFGEKVMLMRLFDPHDKNANVPDPYFGGADGFQQVYEILERSVEEFLDWVVEKHQIGQK